MTVNRIGRGRQVIAVARTADIILMMLDAAKGEIQVRHTLWNYKFLLKSISLNEMERIILRDKVHMYLDCLRLLELISDFVSFSW